MKKLIKNRSALQIIFLRFSFNENRPEGGDRFESKRSLTSLSSSSEETTK